MLPYATLLDLVTVHGPWLIFLMTFLETSFITGLVVPAGVAISIAVGLAREGDGSLPWVVAAAMGGGGVGDSVGFWIGREGRERWLAGSGLFARRVRHAQENAARHLGRNPFLSVTIGRVISFVRTIMPMAVGMSDLSYRRFLTYDMLGLALWCALYVSLGMIAEEGWHWAARLFGVEGATIALGIVAVLVLMLRRTRGGGRERKRRA